MFLFRFRRFIPFAALHIRSSEGEKEKGKIGGGRVSNIWGLKDGGGASIRRIGQKAEKRDDRKKGWRERDTGIEGGERKFAAVPAYLSCFRANTPSPPQKK